MPFFATFSALMLKEKCTGKGSAAVTKMAMPFRAPANFRNFVRILAIISVLRSIDLPFLLERSSGKTILYEFSNTRAPKRAFHRSTVRYTANGDSSFNPTFINLEPLKAGDVELNPEMMEMIHQNLFFQIEVYEFVSGMWNN